MWVPIRTHKLHRDVFLVEYADAIATYVPENHPKTKRQWNQD
jgi:hypothetical protein